MDNLVIGVLAHVDSGKTTLSEAILYQTGVLRSMGRVDNRDTLLDSDEMERDRGITIFSKQADFDTERFHVTWIDTPGHVDFSAEMERTLQVLDYAVLVISASDGVQGHTRTLWRLLQQYHVPVFVFVNKMDQPDNMRERLMEELCGNLSEGCVDFTGIGGNGMEQDDEHLYHTLEEIAVLSQDEALLDGFLASGTISDSEIASLIKNRHVFPCYFGSALKSDGVGLLLAGMDRYMLAPKYEAAFGARIYKITRDTQGNRLTHMKITGGVLRMRDQVTQESKVNQIRVYTGERFETCTEIPAGRICAVIGLNDTYAGQGLGSDAGNDLELLEPVLTYSIFLPEGISARQIYPGLKQLEEEMPELHVVWDERTEELCVRLMGQVQMEILTSLIEKRFGFIPQFGMGRIIYKETIQNPVIGVGHFEPLRHYAEVHLLMEPAERGSGLVISADCSEDILDRNWQRLIMTHIREISHKGVLTGSAITDMRITVINGRAHKKHTEGGDFRQATYRAIRQGLMQAESVLLEPYYNFRLEIPSDMVGRAMTDMENMHAIMDAPDIQGEHAVITGSGPVAAMRDYQVHVNSYTRGTGSISVSFRGYEVCHNSEEVINACNYNPDSDVEYPSASVFCAHGAGFIVPWYEVPDYMHVHDEPRFAEEAEKNADIKDVRASGNAFDYTIALEEIDEIFARTFEANRRSDKHAYKKKKPPMPSYGKMRTYTVRKQLLIVDGYNVIFAWEDLKALAGENIDSAKDRLIQILSNYQALLDGELMLVFDGYKVKGNRGSHTVQDAVTVIHTKEDETADHFIEKFAHENREQYEITVATSDGMIQQIVRGAGGRILSSRELRKAVEHAAQELRDKYHIQEQ